MFKTDVLIRQNYENSKKLNEKNNKIYADIVLCLRGSNLDCNKVEEIISDVLDMFLRSQEECKELEDILGEDYKSFCDSIIEEAYSPQSILTKLWYYFSIIVSGLFVLLTIDLVIDYAPTAIKNWTILNYSLKLSNVIIAAMIILLSFAIIQYVSKTSFTTPKSNHTKLEYLLFGIGYCFFIALSFVISKFLNYKLISLNLFYVLIPTILYWIYKLIIKKIIIRIELNTLK